MMACLAEKEVEFVVERENDFDEVFQRHLDNRLG